METDTRRRVRFTAPEEVEVTTEAIPAIGPDEVRVRTQYSAISPGTERLVYSGQVPDTLLADATIEALEGEDLSFPLSYGYACVGRVEEVGTEVSEEWRNASVFAFQPHVSHFVTSPESLIRVPSSVDLRDAVMIPSVETAVNLVMDGRPMIGEVAIVFGQGVVGLLTVRLLADHPLGMLLTVDLSASRRARSEAMGVTSVSSVSELPQVDGFAQNLTQGSSSDNIERADLVYELTGRPSVLNDAVDCTGFDGRIVVGSWYGTKTAPIDLGGRFHRSRMQIISSQVSTIDPSLRGRWTKDRRMSVVLDLLPDLRPSDLITDRFAVEAAPRVYNQLTSDVQMLQPIFEYQ
jgi:2-desacetyl-2-hydroxyethyl bacteriochlorophyllide A dehydrogenase